MTIYFKVDGNGILQGFIKAVAQTFNLLLSENVNSTHVLEMLSVILLLLGSKTPFFVNQKNVYA